MKLIHDPSKTEEFKFTVEPFSEAGKAAVDAIRNWRTPGDLLKFARERHGYGNSDGFSGITYPGDLDDYDRADSESIPGGSVEAYAWHGATNGDTHVLSELEYLSLLCQYFEACGQHDVASRVEALQTEIAEQDVDLNT